MKTTSKVKLIAILLICLMQTYRATHCIFDENNCNAYDDVGWSLDPSVSICSIYSTYYQSPSNTLIEREGYNQYNCDAFNDNVPPDSCGLVPKDSNDWCYKYYGGGAINKSSYQAGMTQNIDSSHLGGKEPVGYYLATWQCSAPYPDNYHDCCCEEYTWIGDNNNYCKLSPRDAHHCSNYTRRRNLKKIDPNETLEELINRLTDDKIESEQKIQHHHGHIKVFESLTNSTLYDPIHYVKANIDGHLVHISREQKILEGILRKIEEVDAKRKLKFLADTAVAATATGSN